MNSEAMSTDLLLEDDVTSFKWTPEIEKYFLLQLMNLKPFGANKFVRISIIQDIMKQKHKIHIPLKCIMEYLNSNWDMQALDSKEMPNMNKSKQLFELPEEYKPFISDLLDEIKIKQEKVGVNDEINKIKLYSGPSKTRFKSMSSVDSKYDLNEPGTSSRKVSEREHEEIPSIRRSLRTYDKPEEKELQDSTKKTNKLPRMINKTEIKKVTDSKQTNKNIQNQSKDLEKNNAVSIVKRKNRNVSESSFSSDNSKQYKYLKNNLTDLNVSDCSSRSVTPEMFRGKTSNRSVTPETNSRKTNLRSSDKDQKSKLSLKKKNSDVELERFKPEMLEKSGIDLKSKHLVQNKNELKQGKNKTRGRLTADLMVAQQSPVIQPLGRRSCSNNKSS